ncbi:MAG: hypothetical protein EXS31_10135 [Pedosphaera sp.]|nr:hypothetical protein [Pedosphaera sp.]
MIEHQHISNYIAACQDFIRRRGSATHSESTDGEFDFLARSLFRLQFDGLPLYRRFCEARGATQDSVSSWQQIPALPVAAFKEFEVTTINPRDRVAVFHSSGTTAQSPGRHFHSAESLVLYEASLLSPFKTAVLGDFNELAATERVGSPDKLEFLILTPPPAQVPHSSLVHMFETVRREFGANDSMFVGRLDPSGAWEIDNDAALFALRRSMCANHPLLILGTAFSFVHLMDRLAVSNIRYKLVEGSRVMETGGYKGRSRALPRPELHELIARHLGIPASNIVCEYGMSELSSQAYDLMFAPVVEARTALTAHSNPPRQSHTDNVVPVPRSPVSDNDAGVRRVFRFPPWARARVISPENSLPVADGEMGIIQVFDLANARSVMAIQTEDLAIKRGDGFELIGRTALAEPRGCSLMAAELFRSA